MPEIGIMKSIAQELKIFVVFKKIRMGQVLFYQFFGHCHS